MSKSYESIQVSGSGFAVLGDYVQVNNYYTSTIPEAGTSANNVGSAEASSLARCSNSGSRTEAVPSSSEENIGQLFRGDGHGILARREEPERLSQARIRTSPTTELSHHITNALFQDSRPTNGLFGLSDQSSVSSTPGLPESSQKDNTTNALRIYLLQKNGYTWFKPTCVQLPISSINNCPDTVRWITGQARIRDELNDMSSSRRGAVMQLLSPPKSVGLRQRSTIVALSTTRHRDTDGQDASDVLAFYTVIHAA